MTPAANTADRGTGERERAPGPAPVVPFPRRHREPAPAALPETPARKAALGIVVVPELTLRDVEMLLAHRNAVTFTVTT